MIKKQRLPNLVAVLVLTLITAVMWVSFSVYRAVVNNPAPVVPAEVEAPLTPVLDNDSMTQIESRLFIDESQIPDNVVTQQSLNVTPLPVATPFPTPTPIPAEPSAEPEPEESPAP